MVAQLVKVELRIVMPGAWAMMHSLCTPAPTAHVVEVDVVDDQVGLGGALEAAEHRALLVDDVADAAVLERHAVAPPCSNTAPVVLVPPASRSSPSKVMLFASDLSLADLVAGQAAEGERLGARGTVWGP